MPWGSRAAAHEGTSLRRIVLGTLEVPVVGRLGDTFRGAPYHKGRGGWHHRVQVIVVRPGWHNVRLGTFD